MQREQPLRIQLARTGGFTGIPLRISMDTDQLDSDEAQEYEQLVNDLDLDALSAASGGVARGADRMRYDLFIARGDNTWRASFSEDRVPDELRPLLRRLLRAARRGPRE